MSRPTSRVSARRPSAPRQRWNRWRGQACLLACAVALVTLISGCASFPDNGPRQWHDKIENGGPLAAPPRIPDDRPPDSSSPPTPQPNQPGQGGGPTGCVDPDPQVVATCLDPLSAVAVLPDGQSALVAERSSGRVLRVHKDKDPELVATIPVDPAAGGLIGLVLSPSYAEDQLLYAYVGTAADHRVVRVAPGEPPVPILTGIPGTPGNDSGALGVDRNGALLVATGGDGPLGGKLLRIDTFGHPAKGNPDPASPVFSSGLRAPAGICAAADDGTVWVTDRGSDRDALYRVIPGRLGAPAWNWPDRPGVAGCVAPKGAVAVAERGASALFVLRTNAPGSFTGTPRTLLAGTYGRLSPAALGPDGLLWLGTTNKGGGGPVASSDDRAIRIQPPSAGGGGGPD